MKQHMFVLPLVALLAVGTAANAETLLIDRVKQEPAGGIPMRGQNMTQVESKYGAPQQKLDPRGGQKHAWPTINRWVYPTFTVYFEKQKVIDVVANHADAEEIGPKPPIR